MLHGCVSADEHDELINDVFIIKMQRTEAVVSRERLQDIKFAYKLSPCDGHPKYNVTY